MYQYEGLPSKETQGWLKDDSGYPLDWDADEIIIAADTDDTGFP